MRRILQYGSPDDRILATGETHSAGEFIGFGFAEVSRAALGGPSLVYTSVNARTDRRLVEVDPLFSPSRSTTA